MSESKLHWLNSLPLDDAVRELLQCCGSRRWSEKVAEQRPFLTLDELIQKSAAVWRSLDQEEWLAAFRAHPRIGEQQAAIAGSVQAQQWSGQEQAGVQDANHATVETLASLNRVYDEKFGHIFIVCATGKSSQEMLLILRQRLTNDAAEEVKVAANEQAKITELRLRKLLA